MGTGQPVRTKTKEPIPYYVLLILLILSGLSLIVLNIYFIFDTRIVYSIRSDGTQTFSIFEGKLSFILDNNADNANKTMIVYGLYNSQIDFMISASKLFEEKSGFNIPTEKILFDNNSSSTIKISQNSKPQVITIFIGHSQPGVYHGSIFVEGRDNSTSIPITVDIKPSLDRVIIWVINGIAIAIIFWKVVKYYNQRYELLQKNSYKILSLKDFLKEKKITWGTIGKNLILDVSSIFFGILTGVFALLNNSYITEIRILDLPSLIVLLGIGLGIGSLKEFVYAASEPKN